jgi:hypothetical protein
MGHYTVLGARIEEALHDALDLRARLTAGAPTAPLLS